MELIFKDSTKTEPQYSLHLGFLPTNLRSQLFEPSIFSKSLLIDSGLSPPSQNPLRGGPGRGEWPSGQKRQTVNLLKFFYVGSNPASPTELLCCRLKRRERKGGIRRQRRKKADRANMCFLFFCRAVKFNCIVFQFREVAELLRSIDSHRQTIPTRIEASRFRFGLQSLSFSLCSGRPSDTRAPARMPPCFCTKPKPIHRIGEGKTPHFIAPGEGKFSRGLEARQAQFRNGQSGGSKNIDQTSSPEAQFNMRMSASEN